MAKKQFFFIVMCLTVVTGMVSLYAVLNRHFSRRPDYVATIDHLQRELDRERLRTANLAYQLQDYRQSVAKVLPQIMNETEPSDVLRGLASVTQNPSELPPVDLSPVLVAKGKSLFQQKKFEAALATFSQIIIDYPLSLLVVDAHYFRVECYYKMKDFKKALDEIDHMIALFPLHPLTGYGLLRSGQISESHHQIEEAVEIFKTVQRNFTNPLLKKQAQKLIEQVEVL